jgi:hypothetical protein
MSNGLKKLALSSGTSFDTIPLPGNLAFSISLKTLLLAWESLPNRNKAVKTDRNTIYTLTHLHTHTAKTLYKR